MHKQTNKDQANNDSKEFRNAVKGTKRIYCNRFDLQKNKIKKKPLKFEKMIDKCEMSDYLSDEWETIPVDFEENLSFSDNGVDFKTMQALKKAKIYPEDHLDLHGFTMVQAREELSEFLHFSVLHDIRCVRIIHGKGYKAQQTYPLLKNKVNSWLRQHPQVLAFHSAMPKDGGTGAVYVLLRNTPDWRNSNE